MNETILAPLTLAQVDEIAERALRVQYLLYPECEALIATVREQQARIAALESERGDWKARALLSLEDGIREATAALRGKAERSREVREDLAIEKEQQQIDALQVNLDDLLEMLADPDGPR